MSSSSIDDRCPCIPCSLRAAYQYRKAVRIATRFTEDGKKVRVTVGKNASGSILPKPAQLLERKKPRPVVDGPKDTAPDTVGKVTFNGVW